MDAHLILNIIMVAAMGVAAWVAVKVGQATMKARQDAMANTLQEMREDQKEYRAGMDRRVEKIEDRCFERLGEHYVDRSGEH